MDELVVSKKRWLRGDKAGDKSFKSYSLAEGVFFHDKSNCFCIMGHFFNKKARIPKWVLLNTGSSEDLEDKYCKIIHNNFPELLSFESGDYDDTNLFNAIVRTNDSDDLKPKEREKKLKDLFKKHLKIKLKFVP